MAEHILVVYFSHSGNTYKIAKVIHQEVGGTIHEIQPEVPYPNYRKINIIERRTSLNGERK